MTYDDAAGRIMAHAFNDELEKLAVVGWGLDALNLGIPSGVGYALGRKDSPGSDASAEREAKRKYNLLMGALVPGYTGYHYGKKSRAKEAVERRDEQRKKGKK